MSFLRNGLLTKIQSGTDRSRQVALLRTETPTRKIGNINDVLTLLQREGFNSFEVGRMPFLEQVSLFMNAETVVAVLGSSLTGLLYAPKNIKVVSMAPENFSDRFFYAMIQNRHGYYADVRGNVTETAALYHWATFNVNPTTVTAALSTLNAV